MVQLYLRLWNNYHQNEVRTNNLQWVIRKSKRNKTYSSRYITLHRITHHITTQHTSHCITPSPHIISPHLTSPHLTSPHLTSPHLTSPHITSHHITSTVYYLAQRLTIQAVLQISAGGPYDEPTKTSILRYWRVWISSVKWWSTQQAFPRSAIFTRTSSSFWVPVWI